MGKRINESFLNLFAELDKRCCEMFGIVSGGVTEYINRLNNARFAPGRDDALPKLVRLRNLRNRMVHEPGALRKINEITKADITWVKRFDKNLQKRRDPISQYLKKARAYARRRRVQRGAIIVASVVLILALAVILFVTCSK